MMSHVLPATTVAFLVHCALAVTGGVSERYELERSDYSPEELKARAARASVIDRANMVVDWAELWDGVVIRGMRAVRVGGRWRDVKKASVL